MKLVSWNVNGLRSVMRSGFDSFLREHKPDVLCLQEVKATAGDVDPSIFEGYDVTWNSAEKKGYSGVLIATRHAPIDVRLNIGHVEHDGEGRVLVMEFPEFQLVTVYTPNSRRGLTRLDYRLRWDADFQRWLKKLDRRKPVICCGDLNCAHEEIDLANPRENRRNAGFTDEERTSFARMLKAGFVDSFRALHPGEPGHYSWWTYRLDARARNIGWRIDYWLVSQSIWPRVKRSAILNKVTGSDHCPVLLELNGPPEGQPRPVRKRRSAASSTRE